MPVKKVVCPNVKCLIKMELPEIMEGENDIVLAKPGQYVF